MDKEIQIKYKIAVILQRPGLSLLDQSEKLTDIYEVFKEQLALHDVSGSFSATEVERAYDDGYSTDGEVTFDINNYR